MGRDTVGGTQVDRMFEPCKKDDLLLDAFEIDVRHSHRMADGGRGVVLSR